jgi:DNA-binding transcriptional regulator GbsR (MarR family)
MSKQMLHATDIAEITGMSVAHGYKVIKQLNKELEERGFLTFRGRVNKKYFDERVYGSGEGSDETRK